jgi:hypothetical protein
MPGFGPGPTPPLSWSGTPPSSHFADEWGPLVRILFNPWARDLKEHGAPASHRSPPRSKTLAPFPRKPAYKIPYLSSLASLFFHSRNASNRRNYVIRICRICGRSRSIPATLVSPSPSFSSYVLSLPLAHPLMLSYHFISQKNDAGVFARSSPPPRVSPVAPLLLYWRQTTSPFTQSRSSRLPAHRPPPYRSRRPPEHRQHPFPGRDLTADDAQETLAGDCYPLLFPRLSDLDPSVQVVSLNEGVPFNLSRQIIIRSNGP